MAQHVKTGGDNDENNENQQFVKGATYFEAVKKTAEDFKKETGDDMLVVLVTNKHNIAFDTLECYGQDMRRQIAKDFFVNGCYVMQERLFPKRIFPNEF